MVKPLPKWVPHFSGRYLKSTISQPTWQPQATNLILGTGGGANGGQYDRPSDDGTAVIWNGIANIDLAGFLTSQNINGDVTKVRLRFDNTLQTAADDVSSAFIKKKSVDIVVTTEMVPEPTSALLLVLGLTAMPWARRNRCL